MTLNSEKLPASTGGYDPASTSSYDLSASGGRGVVREIESTPKR